MKFARRQDRNHAEIAQYLRRHGVTVEELLKPLDLLIFWHGWSAWVEVKSALKDEKYTRTQLKWIAQTPFPVIFAFDGDQAFQAIKDRQTLTVAQKTAITRLLVRNTKEYFTSKDVRDAIEWTG